MPQLQSCHERRPWVAATLLLGWYLLLAFTRRIDADEGYFLSAARLTLSGQLPWVDFHFPQMPLVAWMAALAQAPVRLLAGAEWSGSWLVARGFAAVLAWIAALAMWLLLRRQVKRTGVLCVLFGLYLLSDLGLEWAPTTKGLLPPALFLLVACLALPQVGRPSGTGRYLVVGMLCGLAVMCRLTALPLALVIGMWTALHAPRRTFWRVAGMWLMGFLLALAPALALIAAAPLRFYMSAIFYHGMQPEVGRTQWLLEHIQVLADRTVSLPLFWVLLAAALVSLQRGVIGRLREAWHAGDAALLYAVLYVTALAAAFTPPAAFHQYYAMATPWLILAAAGSVDTALSRCRAWSAPVRWSAAVVLALLLLIDPYRSVERRWPVLSWLPAAPEAAVEFDYRLATVRAIGREIDRLALEESSRPVEVLSWWPGYIFGSHQRAMPGMHDHFALRFSKYMQPQVPHGLGLPTNADVDQWIAERRPALIVVGIWAGVESWTGPEHYHQLVQAAGYREAARIGSTVIYRRQQIALAQAAAR